jgi:quercetin dioxygenase-like cupin family protein
LSERQIICENLDLAIDDLKRDGFRLDVIFPADEPQSAVLSRANEKVRLSTSGAPSIASDLPPFASEFVLTRAGTDAGKGRAGMLYRDLIPGRLGGRYIASHISIPQGGPVEDWVHYHQLALQLIFVARGWVKVVYEDQGPPFVMEAGDLVLQPPGIRHRVLESSAGLEVVEISSPAVHATFADYKLQLPNSSNPARTFGTQEFLRHVAAETPWRPFGGGEAQETGLLRATAGAADARIIRAGASSELPFGGLEGELVFGFVLDGTACLEFAGHHSLAASDAFVIPPDEPWRLSDLSADFRLLQVTTWR